MDTLHVVFARNDTDPRDIIKSIKKFNGDKTLMICSQSEEVSNDLKGRTGDVFQYDDDFLIRTDTLSTNEEKLIEKIMDYIENGWEIQFNITFAGPFESYLAHSIGLQFPSIDLGAISQDGRLHILNMNPPGSFDSLKEDEKILLSVLGGVPKNAGMTFKKLKEENITTSKKVLKDRGLQRILNKMRGKYVDCRLQEKSTGSGKRPYLWYLTKEGLQLYDNNLNALQILRLKAKNTADSSEES